MSKELNIKQSNIFRSVYEIYDGKTIVARLRTKGLLKTTGLATINGEEWKFSLQNQLGRTINATNSNQTLTFKADTLQTTGSFQIDNRRYIYKRIMRENSSHGKIKPVAYVWSNENQEELINIHFTSLVKMDGIAVVSDTEPAKNYLLLLLLALFRLKVESRP